MNPITLTRTTLPSALLLGLSNTQSLSAVATGADHPYFWAPFILMGNWL